MGMHRREFLRFGLTGLGSLSLPGLLHLRAEPRRKIPNFVGVNGISSYDGFIIAGPGYLGPSYEPFRVTGDPNSPNFEVPNIGLKGPQEAQRLNERIGLRDRFDSLHREV